MRASAALFLILTQRSPKTKELHRVTKVTAMRMVKMVLSVRNKMLC